MHLELNYKTVKIVISDLTLSNVVNGPVLWRFLTSYLEVNHLEQWIDTSYPSDVHTPPTPQWPYTLRLAPELLTDFTNTTRYIREKVLDSLAR